MTAVELKLGEISSSSAACLVALVFFDVGSIARHSPQHSPGLGGHGSRTLKMKCQQKFKNQGQVRNFVCFLGSQQVSAFSCKCCYGDWFR